MSEGMRGAADEHGSSRRIMVSSVHVVLMETNDVKPCMWYPCDFVTGSTGTVLSHRRSHGGYSTPRG